jgi:hypothetical protein
MERKYEYILHNKTVVIRLNSKILLPLDSYPWFWLAHALSLGLDA